MRIVIHYMDNTRKAFDASALVLNKHSLEFEFVSEGVTCFVPLADVLVIYIHEDFDNE